METPGTDAIQFEISLISNAIEDLAGRRAYSMEKGRITFEKIIVTSLFFTEEALLPARSSIAHLFDSIRYEVYGKEIDRTKMVWITSTAKTSLTSTNQETRALKIAG